MLSKFEDIYNTEDPDNMKGMKLNNQSVFENVDASSTLAKRKKKASTESNSFVQ